MDFLLTSWNYVVPFLVVLTILVFVHEMGHYLVARINGVRVKTFSIGFGPEIWGWDDTHGTRWKISWLPLGGYVQFFGDASEASTPDREALETLTEEERAVAFQFKKLHQRAAIVAAGPLANFLFAVLALVILFVSYGRPYTPPVVGAVIEGSAAEAAGLMDGDRIVGIDGSSIARFEDLQQIVRMRPDEPMMITVERNGAQVSMQATPQRQELEDRFGNRQIVGLLGITRTGVEFAHYGVVMSTVYAVEEVGNIISMTLQALGQMIMGSRTTDELGGPIRIAQMSGQIAQDGVGPLLWFMVVLSVNLGLINLFPVPMLDGGHLLYYGFEAARGRPLGEKIQEMGFRIGLSMILLLMLFATWNDLSHLSVFEFLGDL